MANLFGGADLASGYANARPPVHPRVIERAHLRLNRPLFERSLDVGCGAGLSTRALSPVTRHAIGLEPAEAMLRNAVTTSNGSFVVGRGEGLPFADASIDFITAAGSLNYTDGLGDFFRDARRVLKSSAGLLVYDFSPGRNAALEPWFAAFMDRYPRARDNARYLDPAILGDLAQSQFQLAWSEQFQIPIQLDHDFYVNYMMTETNVADAIRRGVATAPEIRDWCSRETAPAFAGAAQDIVFTGYMVFLQ